MTNYSERLDEILAKHNGELGVTWEDPDIVTPDTKQAITSLIKELVAEANLPNEYQDRLLKMLENENGVGSTS